MAVRVCSILKAEALWAPCANAQIRQSWTRRFKGSKVLTNRVPKITFGQSRLACINSVRSDVVFPSEVFIGCDADWHWDDENSVFHRRFELLCSSSCFGMSMALPLLASAQWKNWLP